MNNTNLLKILKNNLIDTGFVDSDDFYSMNNTQGFTTAQLPYYLDDVRKNLYHPLPMQHLQEYRDGDGDELKDKPGSAKNSPTPAKMKSLHSSSAMTTNILGALEVIIKPNNFGITPAHYDISYEKKLQTLKSSRAKANLDAYLWSKSVNEAIYFEMKMFEWLGPSQGPISDAYREPFRYETSAAHVFMNLFDDIKNGNVIFNHYDAVQMLKHTLAIYNDVHNTSNNRPKKVTLVNCLWKIQGSKLSSAEQMKYARIWTNEIAEGQRFINSLSKVTALFKSIGVNFEIVIMTHCDVIDMIEKDASQLNYLERYTV